MNAIEPSRETGPSLAKIPVTIVTGFLGAGKTTLIRHVLENAGGRRLALVINEFGDVGVDGDVELLVDLDGGHLGLGEQFDELDVVEQVAGRVGDSG